MRTLQSLSALVVLSMFVVGCSRAPDVNPVTDSGAKSTDTIATALNTHCPIMGGKVADDGGRVEWNGQTVGFCCPDCIPEWNKLSDEEKRAKLADDAGDSAQEDSHDNHDHGDHS